MSDKTWIRLASGVVAEVEYDRYEYDIHADEIPGKLTGVVRMTRSVVLDGMFGLEPSEEDSADSVRPDEEPTP
jgi:hypothetical protein